MAYINKADGQHGPGLLLNLEYIYVTEKLCS